MRFENFSALDQEDKHAGWFFINALCELKKKLGISATENCGFNAETPLNIQLMVNGVEFPFVNVVQEMYNQLHEVRQDQITQAVEKKLKEIFDLDPTFFEKRDAILAQYLEHLESKLPKET